MENAAENQNPASLMQAPLEDVAEKLIRLVRTLQPQVVLTHDPSGGYFHPDHIKVHQATVLAFHSSGDPGRFPEHLEAGLAPYQAQKLYYTAFPRGMLRLVARLVPLLGQDPEAFGRNRDINLRRVAEVDQAVTTRIKIRPYLKARQQAAQCHASQTSVRSGRVTNLLDRLVRFDTSTRAVPPFESSRIERDLFAGIDGGPGQRRKS
jgi:LmbE family N-acetylglucosaminyl deacetylase